MKGFWKIMPIPRPRTDSISRWLKVSRSRPSNITEPRTTRPGGWIKPMIDSAVTLLPEPDSPTMVRISSCSTVRLTPSTALTTPFARKK